MPYRKIVKEIQQGVRKPVYVLYGTQPFLMDEMVKFMIEQWTNEVDREMNLTRTSLNEQPLDQLLMEAETFPFMSEHRLCIGTEAIFLTGQKQSSKVEHNVDYLQDYVNNAPSFTTLILTVSADKLDERKKIVKLLKEKGEVVSFLPFKEEELKQWIVRRAKHHKANINLDAVDLLVQNVGDQLQLLDQEIKKCATFVGENGEISTEVVQSLVVFSIEQNIFSLIEEISKLRLQTALHILYDLLRNKEEPIKIIALLARQFRNMIGAKELSSKGYSANQIATAIKLHPYAVKIAIEQSQSFSEQKLRQAILQLAELDYKIKSGQVDKVLGLELFIMSLRSTA